MPKITTTLILNRGLTSKVILKAVRKPIEDTDRVQCMIENAPFNFMMVDAKAFNVLYINPASEKLLRP